MKRLAAWRSGKGKAMRFCLLGNGDSVPVTGSRAESEHDCHCRAGSHLWTPATQGPSSRSWGSQRWPGDLLKSLARVATEKHMKGIGCQYHVGGKELGVQGQDKVNFG